MKVYPKTSLIIATYNNPKALELVLLSVLNLRVLPNEVIIADDGSTNQTKELIESFRNKLPIPLMHVWHEDKGFRLAAIRNLAIAKANFEYIIQIDGDIIMHKNFVKDHVQFAAKNQFLFGSRVNITESFLEKLHQTKQTKFHFFSKGISKRFRSIYFPFATKFVKQNHVVSSKLRGCNMSFWRNDIIKINGYNEDFVGWGGDDSELANRLHNNNIAGLRLKNAAIIFHIYHKEADKSNLERNIEIQMLSRNQKHKTVKNGISKYL